MFTFYSNIIFTQQVPLSFFHYLSLFFILRAANIVAYAVRHHLPKAKAAAAHAAIKEA